MPRNLLYLIVFIEGFCSLGAEIIALRRLVPHVGSAIVVTAPTIGLFLLALALGYASGARVSERYTAVVARNFLISALLAGLGLAETTPGPLIIVVAFVGFVGGWVKQVAGPGALFLGAALAACVAVLKLIGFMLAFGLLTWFIIAIMFKRPQKQALAYAVGGAVGFYALFTWALELQLPVGTLFQKLI